MYGKSGKLNQPDGKETVTFHQYLCNKKKLLFVYSFIYTTVKLKYPLLAKSEEVGRGGYQVHIYYI